jgi:hypothetical protein
LGAKARLNEKPTGKNKEEMGPHQYTTRLSNAEVNLASDWMIEQKPQPMKHKRYIHHCCRIIMFLYKEDADFDLAGNVVQVRDAVSPKKDHTPNL